MNRWLAVVAAVVSLGVGACSSSNSGSSKTTTSKVGSSVAVATDGMVYRASGDKYTMRYPTSWKDESSVPGSAFFIIPGSRPGSRDYVMTGSVNADSITNDQAFLDAVEKNIKSSSEFGNGTFIRTDTVTTSDGRKLYEFEWTTGPLHHYQVVSNGTDYRALAHLVTDEAAFASQYNAARPYMVSLTAN